MMRICRRSFLKRTAAVVAGWCGIQVVPARILGAEAPSRQIHVGVIGVGGRGNADLNAAMHQPGVKIVAVADPFQSRRERTAARVNRYYRDKVCRPYRDLRELIRREDIDAIIIATPDHWHVPAALMAIRAGKDVYVEKPLGLSLEEDFTLRREVQRLGRIFQYGTQQRSMAHIRFGCELVRNGRLGKIQKVEVTAPSYGYEGGSLVPIPVPKDLDYDLWLGPAPWRPYTKDRCTCWGAYWCSDNAHGFIGGWGAHPLTDMVWALGDDPATSIPVEYEGYGKFGTGLFDAPYYWNIRGRFANGVPFHFTPGPDCVHIVGDRGQVWIRRSGLRTDPPSLKQERIGPEEIHLYESPHHMGNFLECVRTRRQTVAPIEVAVMSDTITQLSMIAIWTGRKIRWDPVQERILGDPQAEQLRTRPHRPPWGLEVEA